MNEEIARILFDIGEYLAMQDVPFKPRAYAKAAQAVGDLQEDVRDIYSRGGLKELMKVPGVGRAIAEKIEEYLRTGRLEYYEKLKLSAPVDLSELTAIEGLGPKSIRRLYEELGVRTLADLEVAAKSQKIRELAGFGKRTEEKILANLAFAQTAGKREILGFILPRIAAFETKLRSIPGVNQVVAAGSARRRRDTVGDLDFLAVADDPALLMERFTHLPEVVHVIAKGDTKSSVKLRGGLNMDLRVVPAESFGAALNYFTGSKAHNVAMRQLAQRRGWKLNEYGLYSGTRSLAGRTEEDIYARLGMAYVPPELRENEGEIGLALRNALPELIDHSDLRGDMHLHTDWSDGKVSIEKMALAAAARGLKYILVTDHSKRLSMTNGLDEKRILQQMAEIDRLNRALGGKIKVLKGTECDILKDGAMDLPDRILAKLDVVGGSIHSYFNLTREEQTRRLVRAMENPHVDIIFHPTGRLINRRAPYELDLQLVFRTALKTGTVLEVDSYPDRSDLCDEHIRTCVQMGVKLAIDSDAHIESHFDYLSHGISQARRGWARKEDIINSRPLAAMLKCVKSHAP